MVLGSKAVSQFLNQFLGLLIKCGAQYVKYLKLFMDSIVLLMTLKLMPNNSQQSITLKILIQKHGLENGKIVQTSIEFYLLELSVQISLHIQFKTLFVIKSVDNILNPHHSICNKLIKTVTVILR